MADEAEVTEVAATAIPPLLTKLAAAALVGVLGGSATTGAVLTQQPATPPEVEEIAKRFGDLEARVTTLERVARFQGCRVYLEDTGRDPKACAVIYRDLEDFLTEPAP